MLSLSQCWWLHCWDINQGAILSVWQELWNLCELWFLWCRKPVWQPITVQYSDISGLQECLGVSVFCCKMLNLLATGVFSHISASDDSPLPLFLFTSFLCQVFVCAWRVPKWTEMISTPWHSFTPWRDSKHCRFFFKRKITKKSHDLGHWGKKHKLKKEERKRGVVTDELCMITCVQALKCGEGQTNKNELKTRNWNFTFQY